MNEDSVRRPWLKVVGTGIRLGQITLEAQNAIKGADVVFSVVTDRAALTMIDSFNSNHIDLKSCYREDKIRSEIYADMAEHVIRPLRKGQNVCFALYGHPIVFVSPSQLALHQARAEGFEAKVLPGISAEDCIFAELEFDPADRGCQSYCATEFVEEERVWDPRCVLVLWQVSIIGERKWVRDGNTSALAALSAQLVSVYGKDHPVFLFEAQTLPIFPSDIRKVPLGDLLDMDIRPCCTVVLPPLDLPEFIRVSANPETVEWVAWPDKNPALGVMDTK